MHFATTLVSTVSALALVSSAFPIDSLSVEPSSVDTTGGVVPGPGGFRTSAQYQRRQNDDDDDDADGSNSSDGGLEALTQPLVMGVANPLTTGLGRGVAGAAEGTQQAADLLGAAVAALFHVIGGVAANTEQGAGVAVANVAPAVQDTVHAIQTNSGLLGDIVNTVAGREVAGNVRAKQRRQDDSDDEGGLAGITAPVVEDVASPLTEGIGRGVADAAGGTQQTADLLGDAVDTLLQTLGGGTGNIEQGAGVAVANAAPAVQDTVIRVEENAGVAGNVVAALTGSKRQAKQRRQDEEEEEEEMLAALMAFLAQTAEDLQGAGDATTDDSDSDSELLGGVESVVKPILRATQSLTDGLNKGLSTPTGMRRRHERSGIDQANQRHALPRGLTNSLTNGVDTTARGLGDTLAGATSTLGTVVGDIGDIATRQEENGNSQTKRRQLPSEQAKSFVDNFFKILRTNGFFGPNAGNPFSDVVDRVIKRQEGDGNSQAKQRRQTFPLFTGTITLTGGQVTGIFSDSVNDIGKIFDNINAKRSAFPASDESSDPATEVTEDVPESEELDPSATEETEKTEEIEEPEETEEVEETEQTEETKETEETEEPEEIEGTEETEETEQTEEIEQTEQTEETEQTEQIEETEGAEEAKETEQIEEIEQTEETEENSPEVLEAVRQLLASVGVFV